MAKIEEIDLVLGNNEKNNIVSIAEEYYNGKNKTKAQVTDIDKQKEFLDFGTVTYTEKTRASIKVQDGCNNFCSYCLIPYARGRVRSRKRESILEEIEKIAQKGIKEVVITGIHIASYGKDFEEKYEFFPLIYVDDKPFIKAKTKYINDNVQFKKGIVKISVEYLDE